MAVLKFRAYYEEDDSVYRDVVIKHSQTFFDLHTVILKAYEFDNKHQGTFYRSNDNWQRGREITLEKYDKEYKAEPLLMMNTTIGSEIRDTNQKFVYVYDFTKNWTFHLELINISKEESIKIVYPATSRVEGIGPQQYGTRSLLGKKFVDIEEKYDLPQNNEGFSEEGERTESSDDIADSADNVTEEAADDATEESAAEDIIESGDDE